MKYSLLRKKKFSQKMMTLRCSGCRMENYRILCFISFVEVCRSQGQNSQTQLLNVEASVLTYKEFSRAEVSLTCSGGQRGAKSHWQ